MPEVRLLDGPGGPVLENGRVRLAVRLDQGTFSLGPAHGDAVIPSAWTEAVLGDGTAIASRGTGFEVAGERAVEDAQGRGRTLTLRRRAAPGEPGAALDVTLYEEQPFVALQSHLTNAAGTPLTVQAFHVVRTGRVASGGGWRFYRHGWQSWSPTLTLSTDEDDIPAFPPLVDPETRPHEGRLVSELVSCLHHGPSAQTITAGFLTAADQLSQVWLDSDGGLTATSYADGIELAPGGNLSSERVMLDITLDPLTALPRYGDALAREMKATPWTHVVTGWCPWYYYFQRVSEDDILANLERLADLRDELPLEFVQIDDGYQEGIGDWLTPNEKFPRGMAWLAERIHERGFKAGLWLAPFLAGARSRLFAEHPDWLVRNEGGQPVVAIQNWEQLCYALDCTRPEVIDWLERVFRTVTSDWGYDYVKIDFVYAAAVDGVRSDPNVTRAQAYRRGLETIRRAVGERFILGCGAPIGPSVGLVNGMRIGPDVAPYWYPLTHRGTDRRRTSLSFPAAVNAIRNTITRYWTHNRLWLNDPDCLLLRDSETALTAEEVRTLATVIGMSGGMLLDSDDLTRLSPERRAMLTRLLPLRGEAAVPLDLFERDPPRLLWRPDRRLLAIFNWDDEPADVSVHLPAPAERLIDFWTGEEHSPEGGRAGFRGLPAHGSRLLRLR
ncbi:MAG: alpha-galactosidase [Dehalococcoidia bacterium]|nr:alpha-galactosidase [Dehalococcoidia bacterium]